MMQQILPHRSAFWASYQRGGQRTNAAARASTESLTGAAPIALAQMAVPCLAVIGMSAHPADSSWVQGLLIETTWYLDYFSTQ